MRPVHIAGFSQLRLGGGDRLDEAELVQRVTAGALAEAGLTAQEIGFTCSGSNDYVMGRPFSFTMALDGIGPWPPIRESHVEMDGAFALYEAYIRLQHGDVDAALVYAFGASSLCDVGRVRTLELDPYHLAPLGVDPLSLAALQARRLIDTGKGSEAAFAEVVARSRASAAGNPYAAASGEVGERALLAAPYVRDPLRAHDQAVGADGAAAIVLKVGGGGPRIRGIAHAIDAHHPGERDLTLAPSARRALAAAGGGRGIQAAELHALFSSQEGILVDALGLSPEVALSPSGGSLCAEIPMVSGLIRLGEAAALVKAGAGAALGHATSGPLLQHNLVCVLEA